MHNKNINGLNNILTIKSDKINNLNIDIVGDNNNITIETDVVVKGILSIRIEGNCNNVHIGKDTSFEGTEISIAEDNLSVNIGEDCMFAANTMLLATDFHSIFDLVKNKRTNFSRSINIGNHVWLASNAIVLKGVTIGHNSVIGAGSVVHRSVDSNCVAIGSPANVVRKNITWSRNLLGKVEIDEDILKKMVKSSNIDYYIEKDINDTNYELNGWAILKGSDCSNAKMFLTIDQKKNKRKTVVPCYMFNSKDVGEAYNSDFYMHSRFKAIIGVPKDEIKEINLIICVDDRVLYRKIFNGKEYI